MAALCLFCIPLALRFQDDLLERPFKGSGVLAGDRRCHCLGLPKKKKKKRTQVSVGFCFGEL